MEKVNAYITDAPGGTVKFTQVNIADEKGNVTLRPILTGICGTDRGMVKGSLSFTYNPEGYDFLVLGHESLCEVIESDSPEFKKGDRVVPLVRRPGDCPNCRIGRPDNCSDGEKHEAGITGLHGFMRERFKDFDFNLVKVDDPDLGDIAVLTEPTKNVVKAFEVFEKVSQRSVYANNISTYEGKKALIIGTGSEAFIYAFMSVDYGFDTYILNRHPIEDNKIEMCREFGIKFIDSSKEPEFPEKFHIDFLIDTSGDPGTIFKYVRKMNYNGIAILFGTNGKAPKTEIDGEDIDYIIERNITLAGSVDAARIHYMRALDYLSKWKRRHGEAMDKIITGYFKPGDIDLFENKPSGEIKSVIRW